MRANALLIFPMLLGSAFFLNASKDEKASAPSADAPKYRLVWSDEFAGSAGPRPDATKWVYDLGAHGWGNHELETYTNKPENARVRDGNLLITARQEKLTGKDGDAGEYTSARLKTHTKFAQAYGRFEARIKIPRGQGMWPAFWAMGEDIDTVKYPNCGEIDIMENVGKEPGIVSSSLHGPNSKPSEGPEKATTDWSKEFKLPAGQQFADDFHIYAVEWEPDTIRFYVDDNNFGTVKKADWPAREKWTFDHPFFILLNLAVGGDWPGSPDATTQFPQEMLVDYVRVYARE